MKREYKIAAGTFRARIVSRLSVVRIADRIGTGPDEIEYPRFGIEILDHKGRIVLESVAYARPSTVTQKAALIHDIVLDKDFGFDDNGRPVCPIEIKVDKQQRNVIRKHIARIYGEEYVSEMYP